MPAAMPTHPPLTLTLTAIRPLPRVRRTQPRPDPRMPLMLSPLTPDPSTREAQPTSQPSSSSPTRLGAYKRCIAPREEPSAPAEGIGMLSRAEARADDDGVLLLCPAPNVSSLLPPAAPPHAAPPPTFGAPQSALGH